MAELSLPKLSIEITADGSAAISEIQKVGSAAQSASGGLSQMSASTAAVTDAGTAAGQAMENVSAAAEQAGEQTSSMAQGAESAAKGSKELGDNAKKAADGVDKVGDSADKTADKVKTLQESMQKVGSSMTKMVTLPIVAAFTTATKGAADLVETVSKTEVVFGDYYDKVDQWSQSSIDNMGIARSTALEMASLYGDMATGMGFGQAAAADMATELTSLAADMASFKNISIDTAETALKSVFTGETESLKNLGIVMTEANLEAYALAEGIETSYSAMSQAEKVTLRYNYVMAQSKNAQGDFARTGDSLSNQFRKLTQTVKQMGEDLGNLLMPYVSRIVTALQSAVEWITNLDEGTKETILTVAAIVAAIGPLLLVGSKVLKMISSIKAALAVASLNPILLAITGAAAAATLLVTAFKSSGKEIDKTSESYQRAKSTIEKGIATEVTVDDEELTALEGKEYDGGTLTITMPEASKAVVKSASDLIDELKVDDNFEKSLVINGDSSKAQEALGAIETAVNTLLSGEGDANSIKALEDAIAACEELQITPGLDETTYAEVEAKLQTLKDAVAAIKEASVTFKYTEAADSDTKAWEAFAKVVDGWGVEAKTLSAIGKFTIEGATTDEISDYAKALTAAAAATGEYSDAVDALNNVLEQAMQRQIQEIQADATEQIRQLAISHNAGGMSDEEYYAAVQEVVTGAKEATAEIEAETEAQKELNEVFANGTAKDDSKALADQATELYKDSTISWEDAQGYLTSLKEAKESGADMSEYYLDAGVALAGLQAQSVEVFNQMTQATDEYNAAMEQVTEKENEAAQNTQLAENAGNLQNYLDGLQGFMKFNLGSGMSSAEQISEFVDGLELGDEAAQKLKDDLTTLFTMDDGNLMENTEIIEQIPQAQADLSAYQSEKLGEAATASEEAATAAEEAATAYQTSMQTIQTESGFTAEAMAGAMEAIKATGAEVPAETQEQIEAVAGSLDIMNAALADGSTEAASTVSGMMKEVGSKKSEAMKQGRSVGQAIVDGIKAGMNAKKSSLRATATSIANSIPAWMKKILGIASPSKVMRDLIGKNIMAGITAGIEDETTSTYSALKGSLNRIVSGAQSVINRGSYSFPTAQLATSAGGMNYSALGEVLSAAVQDAPVSLIIKDKVIAQTTSDATARNQTIRAQRINRGKGRW